MSATPIDQDEKIDLMAAIAEARRLWWIESGQQERFDAELYKALLAALSNTD